MNNDLSGGATGDDIREFDLLLTRMLPRLLLARDRDALQRWSKTRSWIDNAIDGEEHPSLDTIALAIAYLVETTQLGRP
jgi:hypothetical protein